MRSRRFVKAKWRPQQERGKKNRTEERFEAGVLVPQLATGEVIAYEFEPLRLRIGKDWKTSYTPDFLVQRPDGTIELVEVKGSAGWEEDARVKFKAAAKQFPLFAFVAYVEAKRGGGFIREEL